MTVEYLRTIEDMCHELDKISKEVHGDRAVLKSVINARDGLLDLSIEITKYVQRCLENTEG